MGLAVTPVARFPGHLRGLLASRPHRLYLHPMTGHCAHDHSGDAGLSGSPLAAALAGAEARMSASGERMTASRRRVLEMLLQAGQPVKAYDLMADFAPGEPTAKPPTVYRALEFLEKQGLAHRIPSLNAYVACRVEGGHDAAFLICDCCGATAEVEPRAASALEAQAGQAGFSISAVMVEAHGLCADCSRNPR
jgi:Fur family transcriptional regulator, zinc uptake regulator